MCAYMLSCFSHVQLLCDPMDCNLQVLLSTGFPRKDTGVGCHLLLQGNFPNPEIKPTSPALAGRFFTTDPPEKPLFLPVWY